MTPTHNPGASPADERCAAVTEVLTLLTGVLVS